MYYDANGAPNPTGDFEYRGGSLCLREGGRIGFELALWDSAGANRVFLTDAKSGPPATIDEALRLKFAEMAKARAVSVEEMLSTMQQRDIENTVVDVAKAYVTAQAGAGIASQFAKDAAFITDAERTMIVAKAESEHRTSNAYRASPPPFTDRHATAAVINAIKSKANAQALAAAGATTTADLRVQHDAAYEASKQALRDAHRR